MKIRLSMKIKTSLLLAALAPALMAAVVGVAMFFGDRATRAASEQGRAIAGVIRSVNELNSLVGSYLLYHEERPRQQFMAEHDALDSRLASVELRDAQQRQLLDAVRENADSIKASFLLLVDNHAAVLRNPGDAALRKAGDRVAGQLHVKARQAVADGVRLERLVDDEIASIQTTTGNTILLLIMAVSAATTAVLVATMRKVGTSLATLRRGTEAVGTGDLAYRTNPAGQDELAELGRSLDDMTEKLQSITVSKIELEEEVRQRLQAEQAVRESEERARCIIDNSLAFVGVMGADGTLTEANATALRAGGITREDAVGRKFWDCSWWNYDPGVQRQLRDAVARAAAGHIIRYDVVVRMAGDSRMPIHFMLAPVRDAAGQITHLIPSGIDITERKQAEERTAILSEVTAELLATEQPQHIVESLCRKVMDHLGCHVFFNFLVAGESGRLKLNASAGISEEAARQIQQLGCSVAVCGCAALECRSIVAEHIQITPDARTELLRSFGIQAYACHPLMSQGRVIGTLCFGSRTKPTFAEDELALLRTVADHVAIAMQRVRMLESLERHARAAEAANEAKSQFLANMSHELRTPMNAILGMINVALPKAGDPVARECLRTAKGSADLLLTLLDDLLDSAKIESGKLELESAPFSLRRMLDQMTRVLSVRASEKGLCFCCRVADETPDAVIGDRMRLQQILLNLAGNAIKFTERGEVDVRVAVVEEEGESGRGEEVARRRGDAEKGISEESLVSVSPCLRVSAPPCDPSPPLPPSTTLLFSVRDTGIGIPPDVMERLFQPFAQADASMARRFGGTGLGLSICKSLVDLMGGRIWVQSEAGKGSTFCFTVRLPLTDTVPVDFDAPYVVEPTACRQLRILLVEDNPANQMLATYILQDRGHAVEVAGDGREALSLTVQNRYDVILMDVQMPGMDGLEATAAIRKREGEKGSSVLDLGSLEPGSEFQVPRPKSQDLVAPPRVPIIAMTAHAMKSDRERCLAAGMDGYLSKPVNARELIGLVEGLAWGPAREKPAGVEPLPVESPKTTMPVFDPEEALSRCLKSEGMLREMIGFFFNEVDNLFPQMRAALEKGALEEVGHLGHRMKGTVSYLGAHPAREAALGVERFCTSSGGTASEAEAAVDRLEQECIRLKAVIVRHSPRDDPSLPLPPNVDCRVIDHG